MSFIETPRFPTTVSWGSTSVPKYNTSVIKLRSGHEVRNSIWDYPLMSYNVAAGVRGELELYDLISFFHAMSGRFHGFRYRDRWDYKSVYFNSAISSLDQSIGTGDGSTYQFQLKKTYTAGAVSQTRLITKPVSGTVLIAVASILQTEDTDYTIDYTTGVVSFVSGSTPTVGQAVTAGFEFDVPCRFGSDELPINLETYKAGSVTVNVDEIRV